MKDIIVSIPDFIPKEDSLEYIRGLLPTEERKKIFDYFIEQGLLRLENDQK